MIRVLEYADDACLADTDVKSASRRVTAIQAGALQDADVVVSIPKSEVQHIRKQEDVASPTPAEFKRAAEKGKLPFQCDFCGKRFATKVDMRHLKYCPEAQRGVYDEEWGVDKILDVRGPIDNRFFLVRWEGKWEVDQETWEPFRHLSGGAEEAIAAFWAANPQLQVSDSFAYDGEHRCEWCCKFCSSEAELKRHRRRCAEKPKQISKASKARKVVKKMLQEEKQEEREKVMMGGDELRNVWAFTYLGLSMTVDGDEAYPVEVRLAKASSRFSELHNVWRDRSLSLKLKLQLFEAGVCSMATHAFEAWKLSNANIKRLRLWNAKCLAFITGRSIKSEYKYPSKDLVATLRVRRVRWLGHVLRMEDRLVKSVITQIRQPYPDGSIFMDAPRHSSMEQLIELAEDRESWNLHVNAVKVSLDCSRHSMRSS